MSAVVASVPPFTVIFPLPRFASLDTDKVPAETVVVE
jgi:hypothetical protein